MTAKTRNYAICPSCGERINLNNKFSEWINKNQKLKSSGQPNGYVISDCDYIFHRYKTGHNRECKYIMMVELKTFKAEPDDSQRETLLIVGQFLRNTKETPTKKNYLTASRRPYECYSSFKRKTVSVKAYGMHLLTLETDDPQNGKIWWDRKLIDYKTLEDVLTFTINPDTLTKHVMDLRVHSKKQTNQISLPFDEF